MKAKTNYTEGQVIEVLRYPFILTKFFVHDPDSPHGGFEDEGWTPGCDKDKAENGQEWDFSADGLGAMVLEVVKIVALPGSFQTRIFYVRQWRDPDGKVFGKRRLRVTTKSAFSKIAKGYRHDFYLDGEIVTPTSWGMEGQP